MAAVELPNLDALRKELETMSDVPGVQRCKEAMGPASGPVCVTGATGFIALILVGQLLEKGYTVIGTVRSNRDEKKMAPLMEYQKKYGQEKFQIVSGVDCLVAESFEKAVSGCVGVFHTASPFHFKTEDPLNDLVKPAKLGTESCLVACKKAGGVKRVVVTASFACIVNPGVNPPDYTYSSKDWNRASLPDAEGKFPEPVAMSGYRFSKLIAEKAAWDFSNAEDCPFDVACINPPMVIGKNLNKPESADDINTSSAAVLKVLKGVASPVQNGTPWVDVEDVARAHIFAYEKVEAGGRRFLCACSEVPTSTQVAHLLKELAPNCPIVTDEPAGGPGVSMGMDTSALTSLGFEFTPLKETMRVQAQSFVDMGFLAKL